MAIHARLSPSKGNLWVTCPGGVPFAEANADKIKARDVTSPSGVAELGTKAHSYAEMMIYANVALEEEGRDRFRKEARKLANDLPDEFITNAEAYAAWATEFVMTRPDIPWGLEMGAELWYEPGSQGYADFWAIDKTELIVVDYKSGRLPVEVQDNIQLGIYLTAIYDKLKEFNPQIKTFRAGIMQPFTAPQGRREPVWWTLTMEDLERFRNFISAAAYEVDHPINGQSRLVASEKGCRFCPAKAICPAQGDGIDEFAGMVDELPEALDGNTLFNIFRNRKKYRDFLDTLEDYVRDQDDEVLTRNSFEKKQGSMRRSWALSEGEVVARLDDFGLVPYKKVLKTPAQIEQELDKAAFADMVTVDYNRPSIVDTQPKPKKFRVSRKA